MVSLHSPSATMYAAVCVMVASGLGVHEPFLEMGFYAEQVQRYLNRFPRERIGIWIYEETKTRPVEFMREVFEFLRVDSSFTPDMSKRYHEPQIARTVKANQILRRLGLWQMLKRMTPAPGMRLSVRSAVYVSQPVPRP